MNDRLLIAVFLLGALLMPLASSHAAQGSSHAVQSPSSLSADDQKIYDTAINLIHTYSGSGDNLERAYRHLQDLAQRNPNSGYPLAGLADLSFFASGMGASGQEAYVLAQRAIKLDPKVADAHVVVAKVMIRQGNAYAAQQAADRAIALAPNKPEAMFAKARAAEIGGRYDDAEQWYRRTIERHTDPERKSNIYHWLGDMYKNKKPRDLDKAIAAYEKVVEYTSNKSPWKLNNAALFFISHTDRYDLAIECLQRALGVMEFGAARTNLGLALFYKWGDAYMNPAKYKNAKVKPEDPKTITARTGVTAEFAFGMNPTGPAKPWATLAMLKAGMIANVDVIAPGSGGTALTAAAYGNHLDVVRALIAKGANVNAEDVDNKSSAIFYAVQNNNLEMVKLLVANGARLNRTDGHKRPLIARALDQATAEDLRVLTFLLEKGADPTIPDERGNSLLANAVVQANVPATRLLIQKYRVDPNVRYGEMQLLALAAVTSGGSHEMVKMLLEGGASPWVKYGSSDVLSVLSEPRMRSTPFPSTQQNFDLIQQARKSTPKPSDFGRAHGE